MEKVPPGIALNGDLGISRFAGLLPSVCLASILDLSGLDDGEQFVLSSLTEAVVHFLAEYRAIDWTTFPIEKVCYAFCDTLRKLGCLWYITATAIILASIKIKMKNAAIPSPKRISRAFALRICVIPPHLSPAVRFVTCILVERQRTEIIEKGTMCKMARGCMVCWMAERNITMPLNALSHAVSRLRQSERIPLPNHTGIRQIELLENALSALLTGFTTAEIAFDEIEERAYRLLTGFPNRAAFYTYLTEYHARPRDAANTLTLLYWDLGGFKAVSEPLDIIPEMRY